jgi:hypothetical protein
MIAILRMVFTRGYWRNMAQWDTWRLGWVHLRRCHKDPRSRKYLRRLLLMICAPLLAPLCVLLIFTPGGFIGTLVWMGNYHRKKAQERERLAKLPPKRDPPPPVTPALRRELADLALLHALLADRAGSEDFLRTKVLPEGVEVITRRVQLDALRDRGLYDRLGDVERDLLIQTDGHWTESTSSDIAFALEPLRLLRWALRVDHYLPSVGDCLVLNFKQSHEIATDPDVLYRGDAFIPIDTLDTAFRDAQGFLNRCFAETVHRGLLSAENEEQAAWCRKIIADYSQNEQKDLTLGPTIVSKADDHLVLRARLLAARRSAVMTYVAKRMYGDIPAPESVHAFFLR